MLQFCHPGRTRHICLRRWCIQKKCKQRNCINLEFQKKANLRLHLPSKKRFVEGEGLPDTRTTFMSRIAIHACLRYCTCTLQVSTCLQTLEDNVRAIWNAARAIIWIICTIQIPCLPPTGPLAHVNRRCFSSGVWMITVTCHYPSIVMTGTQVSPPIFIIYVHAGPIRKLFTCRW